MNSALRTEYSDHWLLDESLLCLNHGSFGACPRAILAEQQRLRERMEKSLWNFLIRDADGLFDEARAAMAQFVNCEPGELVFVSNATSAVNTVLRSLWEAGELRQGVEVLTTNHTYNSCQETLNHVAAGSGAKVVIAEVPRSPQSPEEIERLVLAQMTPRTRLALLDHVTSPTAIEFATPRLVAELNRAGVETLIDGAHAPGGMPVNLREMNATYYTGNCHKWLCGLKTAAFLQVRRDRQAIIHPLVTTVRASQQRADRCKFFMEFEWQGTIDFTPYFAVPETIRFMASLMPGGWEQIMRRNHDLAIQARRLVCEKWQRHFEIGALAPESMLTSMFSIPIPDGSPGALQLAMLKKNIEAQIIPWPAAPKRLFRGSMQLYNNLEQYEVLSVAMLECLRAEGSIRN